MQTLEKILSLHWFRKYYLLTDFFFGECVVNTSKKGEKTQVIVPCSANYCQQDRLLVNTYNKIWKLNDESLLINSNKCNIPLYTEF